jgi:hypothetical protein
MQTVQGSNQQHQRVAAQLTQQEELGSHKHYYLQKLHLQVGTTANKTTTGCKE